MYHENYCNINQCLSNMVLMSLKIIERVEINHYFYEFNFELYRVLVPVFSFDTFFNKK